MTKKQRQCMCTRTKSTGKRCKRPPVKGSDYCLDHMPDDDERWPKPPDPPDEPPPDDAGGDGASAWRTASRIATVIQIAYALKDILLWALGTEGISMLKANALEWEKRATAAGVPASRRWLFREAVKGLRSKDLRGSGPVERVKMIEPLVALLQRFMGESLAHAEPGSASDPFPVLEDLERSDPARSEVVRLILERWREREDLRASMDKAVQEAMTVAAKAGRRGVSYKSLLSALQRREAEIEGLKLKRRSESR